MLKNAFSKPSYGRQLHVQTSALDFTSGGLGSNLAAHFRSRSLRFSLFGRAKIGSRVKILEDPEGEGNQGPLCWPRQSILEASIQAPVQGWITLSCVDFNVILFSLSG